MRDAPLRVLLIEDDSLVRQAMAPGMRSYGLVVDTIADVDEHTPFPLPHVIVLDLGLPTSEGRDTVERARHRWPFIPIVVCTGEARGWMHAVCIQEGADSVVVKPASSAALESAVRQAYARRESRTPRAALDALRAILGVGHANPSTV